MKDLPLRSELRGSLTDAYPEAGKYIPGEDFEHALGVMLPFPANSRSITISLYLISLYLLQKKGRIKGRMRGRALGTIRGKR